MENTSQTMNTVSSEEVSTPNANQSSNIVGSLEESELATLTTLRVSARDIVQELGQMEVRKARMLGSVHDIERRAQDLLNKVGERLNIPEGQKWQVTPEGDAELMVE